MIVVRYPRGARGALASMGVGQTPIAWGASNAWLLLLKMILIMPSFDADGCYEKRIANVQAHFKSSQLGCPEVRTKRGSHAIDHQNNGC